jgi:hypothetical protein
MTFLFTKLPVATAQVGKQNECHCGDYRSRMNRDDRKYSNRFNTKKPRKFRHRLKTVLFSKDMSRFKTVNSLQEYWEIGEAPRQEAGRSPAFGPGRISLPRGKQPGEPKGY